MRSPIALISVIAGCLTAASDCSRDFNWLAILTSVWRVPEEKPSLNFVRPSVWTPCCSSLSKNWRVSNSAWSLRDSRLCPLTYLSGFYASGVWPSAICAWRAAICSLTPPKEKFSGKPIGSFFLDALFWGPFLHLAFLFSEIEIADSEGLADWSFIWDFDFCFVVKPAGTESLFANTGFSNKVKSAASVTGALQQRLEP